MSPICAYCGRRIRRGTRPVRYRTEPSGEVLLHKTCHHRLTARDCVCDLCTGAIHGG